MRKNLLAMAVLATIGLIALAASCAPGSKPCVDDLGCVSGQICVAGRCAIGERDGGAADAGVSDGGGSDAGRTGPDLTAEIGRYDYRDGSVQLDSNILINFSEAMDAGSVVVAVSPSVTFTEEWPVEDARTLILWPSGDLAAATTYRLAITGSNQANVAIAPPFEFTFHTQATPDRTPAAVVSTVPANMATGVAPDTKISVTFDEPMYEVTASLSDPSMAFSLPSTTDSRTFTFDMPAYTWAPAQAYDVLISGNDLNANGTVVQIHFTAACLLSSETCTLNTQCCSGVCDTDGGCQ